MSIADHINSSSFATPTQSPMGASDPHGGESSPSPLLLGTAMGAGSNTSGSKLRVTHTRKFRSDSHTTNSSQSTTVTNGTQGDSRSVSTQGGVFRNSSTTNASLQHYFASRMIDVRVQAALIRKATESGAPSLAHPGCWAELRLMPRGVYFGQQLPDDVMIPPLRLFGVLLCYVSFRDVKFIVENMTEDSFLMTLRHRVTGERERILVGLAPGASTVTPLRGGTAMLKRGSTGSGDHTATWGEQQQQQHTETWTSAEALAAIIKGIEDAQEAFGSTPPLRSGS